MTDHQNEELEEFGETSAGATSIGDPRDPQLAEEQALSAHLQQKINQAREALQQGKPTHALDILS